MCCTWSFQYRLLRILRKIYYLWIIFITMFIFYHCLISIYLLLNWRASILFRKMILILLNWIWSLFGIIIMVWTLTKSWVIIIIHIKILSIIIFNFCLFLHFIISIRVTILFFWNFFIINFYILIDIFIMNIIIYFFLEIRIIKLIYTLIAF